MNSKTFKITKKGFTLAEVLITLAIIGVVAAMVVPALLNNTNNKENVVALKKYYSVLNQSYKTYMANNGCVGDIRACLANIDSDATMYNIFKPSLSIIQDCGNAAGLGCWASGLYHYLNGTNYAAVDIAPSIYKVRLADGASLAFDLEDTTCSGDWSQANIDPLFHNCGYVDVDVNGSKGPNQFGRDEFEFFITASGIYPKGMYDDKDYADSSGIPGCDPSSSNTTAPTYQGRGEGCTAKVLQEGAMNY